ncbi:MAG: ankyrin repeat domain-containing protein [Candidatus Binatia bacterium]
MPHRILAVLLAIFLVACWREPADEHDMTALMRGAAAGDVDAVRRSGREPTSTGRSAATGSARSSPFSAGCSSQDGTTALERAAGTKGNAETVRLLLAAGADVNHASSVGHTPLMMAVAAGEEETVRLLIEAGGDVKVRDSDGKSLVRLAEELKHAAVAARLRAAGAPE